MANDALQSEEAFLIGLAVSKFNDQFGRSIDPDGCTIYSLPPDFGTVYGYEIKTDVTTDYLRLRIYLAVERRDILNNFRLETDTTIKSGTLGDEVYVAMGSVSRSYLDNLIYRFRWIEEPEVVVADIALLDGSPFTLMSGQAFNYMEFPE